MQVVFNRDVQYSYDDGERLLLGDRRHGDVDLAVVGPIDVRGTAGRYLMDYGRVDARRTVTTHEHLWRRRRLPFLESRAARHQCRMVPPRLEPLRRTQLSQPPDIRRIDVGYNVMITIALLLLLAQTHRRRRRPTAHRAAARASGGRGAGRLPDRRRGRHLNITVFGEPDASRGNVTVDNDGTIDMPYIGRVKVAGQSARAVEKEVRERLAKDSCSIPRSASRSRSTAARPSCVQGYVRDPGEQILEGNASLTSVLAKAGSMMLDAAFLRDHQPPRAERRHRADQGHAASDIESGEAQNILLKDGDTVLVPKAESILHHRAGAQPGNLTWEEGLTVERALTLAGGPTERAGSIEIERNGKTVKKKAKKSDSFWPTTPSGSSRRWF